MALSHKRVDFTLKPVGFENIKNIEDKSFTSVPVLNDSGKLLGDSFEIATYLEARYPEGPSLFQGAGGFALSRFAESYCKTMLHPPLAVAAVSRMYALMGPQDQAYFRQAREKRFGKPLEEIAEGAGQAIEKAIENLAPMNDLLRGQAWIGGDGPVYGDYVLFGTLQWVHVCGLKGLLEPGSPLAAWFASCLSLYSLPVEVPEPG